MIEQSRIPHFTFHAAAMYNNILYDPSYGLTGLPQLLRNGTIAHCRWYFLPSSESCIWGITAGIEP